MGKIAEHLGHGHMRVPEGWFYKDICPERDEADNSREVAAISLVDQVQTPDHSNIP
jgi:hypothetical protein